MIIFKKSINLLVLLLFIKIVSSVYAEENNELTAVIEAENTDNGANYRFLNFSFETIFNTKDIFLGIGYNFLGWKQYLLFFNAFFYARPYKKSMFVETDQNHYYQFKETRFVFGANCEKIFPLSERFGIQVSGGGIYSFGYYAGTNKYSPESNFSVTGTCGISINYNNSLFFTTGYQYIRIPEIPPNRLFFKIALILGE